ncbi:hypothetical protein [Actinomyces trachealis]|uniref:hypothetical protein n=1 Tax=Actinomyces trachealis TaxID=2763540 RepID=UPI0018C78FDD|nr:hypothetical protein [Actinomyces trachealis]
MATRCHAPDAGRDAAALAHRGATGVAALAPGAHVSLAPACRYLHEALAVLARRAPQLPDVLGELHDQGEPFVCLDTTLHRHRPPRSPHPARQPLVVPG